MNLTENFNKIEFESKDGSKMPDYVLENIKELSRNLQVLRDYTGKPVHITSGYRSPEHNKRVGGVSHSYHTRGMASDIVIRDYTPKKLVRVIEKLIKQGKMKQGGIGLYNSFVHYDIRGTKSRWDNSSLFNF